MNAMLKNFANRLREQGRAERTVEAYCSDLARFVRWSEGEYAQAWTLSMFNRADLREYQRYCRDELHLKAATWNRSVASLAVFAAWLQANGELEYDPRDTLTRAESQKLAPKSLRKPEYKRLRLATGELVRTAKSPAARVKALRDAAVIACLWQAGMREGEVAHLRLRDVLLGARSGRVEVVNTKGNKDREIPLNYEATQALRAWVAVRPAGCGETLFVGKFGEALQERGIQKLLAGVAKAAGIGHVTPHQLRHTAGKTLLDNGATLPEVAAFLGHSSLEVTRRYTLPHYEDIEKRVEVL
jgi:integrase/recombinase XerC